MTRKMRVDLWTDIICPWCGLGSHQLEQAITKFGKDVELVHHSFQLDETSPVGVSEPVALMLEKKKGIPAAQVKQMTARVEQLAEKQGLWPYIVGDNRAGNTSMAHELAAWATEQGKGDAMWKALYKAYFGQARSIFDVESLVTLAQEQGLDGSKAREVLTSRKYAQQVLEDGRVAQRMGVSGVPFVVIDNKYGVSGAQPVEVFVEALTQAWNEREPSAEFPSNAVCGPDGCELPS